MIMIALLCAVAQGAWADKWDGKTEKSPSNNPDRHTVYIHTAAELAYICNHWSGIFQYWPFYEWNFELMADLDMTAATWKPMGSDRFKGTFNGNGHLIRIKIDDSSISSNYQGLFETIGEKGRVKNLHLEGKIKVGNARMVGGIAGNNYGTIENCWVKADVESDHYSAYDADLGGIVGWNESGGTVKYCCMSGNVKNTGGNSGVGGIAGSNDGTIEHVTFYGTVSVKHSQDNKWVGDQDNKLENYYDSFNEGEYNAANGNHTYRRGLKYCVLPNPFVINSTEDWNTFCDFVSYACTFRGKTVRLDSDITISSMAGSYFTNDESAFSGTFDGNGHTITSTIDYQYYSGYKASTGTAPFRKINGATIKNLKVAGSINGGEYVSALVGLARGTGNRIENCVVTANVHGTQESGFVGHAFDSDIAISGCVFNANLLGIYTSKGVFIACSDASGTKTVTDCLYIRVGDQHSYDLDLIKGSGKVTLTNCYKTTDSGAYGTQPIILDTPLSYLGEQMKDYGMVKSYEHGICYNGRYYLDSSVALPGTGTETDPFIIGNSEDWEFFAIKVRNGTSYRGQFVKLTGDISVTEMVGASEGNSFQGTFDGGGHTLTFNQGTSSAPFGEQYCAPFRYVKNASIQNLHVDGTITTSQKFAGGIVAGSYGSLSLTNCRSSVTINSSVSGDGTHGGLVALINGNDNTISACVFDGSFATTNGTTNCGGLIGWSYNYKTTITNSLMAPASVDAGMVENTFVRHAEDFNPTITNSYYIPIANLPTNQGTQAYADIPDGEIAEQLQLANGINYYIPCTVSGVAASYDLMESPSITPEVKDRNQTALTFGTDYTATLNGNEVASLPISISTVGDNTLTLTGKGKYAGTKTLKFTAIAGIQGAGTEADPYIIGSTEDWDLFVSKVNNGKNYSGQFMKLSGDITVTEMVGASEANSFQGTFDGGGHTLTFMKGTSAEPFNEENCAPFRYVKNVTIRNLKMAGNIYTDKRFAAGLIARSYGTTNITGCQVSTVIYSSVNGDATHGGMIVAPSGTLSIEGSTYSGRLLTNNGTTNCGGFIGWHNGATISVTNSLYAPNGNIADGWTPITGGCATFVRGGSAGNTCYYTEAMGNAQGIQVYTAVPDNEIGMPFTAADNKTYFMLCTVSGVRHYLYTGEAITVKPTVTCNGTTLTEGTDYTYTISPETVKEMGDYTLTITAQGGTYTGTKTIHFKVSESLEVTSTSTTLESGVYTAYKDVTIDQRITISGNVVLNLGKGTTLNAKKGIELAEGNTLTINGPGTLTIDGCEEGKSGIGAVNWGDLVINGGTINAQGGFFGAGLGGDYVTGKDVQVHCGSITINGGVVNAKGSFSVGIGGNSMNVNRNYDVTDCNIVINGGQVTASGGQFYPGIGPFSSLYSDDKRVGGTLTLGWTNPDDFVSTSSYQAINSITFASIIFAEGKQFILEGTNTIATAENFNGKKIVPALTLADKADNSEVPGKYDGKQLPVVLKDRTLYKDGNWNTICLPFNLVLEGSPFESATARPLTEASISGTTLNLTFGDAVDKLVAGTPYIIKWESGDHIVSPVFTGVTIDATDRSYDNGASGDQRVRFIGTYKSTAFDAIDKSILLMGGENMLYTPSAGASIGAQRAYFKLGDDDGAANARRITAFNISFGNGETTGILTMSDVRSQMSDVWYSLDGSKLDGRSTSGRLLPQGRKKPTAKGLYIHGNKKVVIK